MTGLSTWTTLSTPSPPPLPSLPDATGTGGRLERQLRQADEPDIAAAPTGACDDVEVRAAARHPNQRDVASLPVALRRAPVPVSVRSFIEDRLRSRVVRVRRLQGASSSAVHRLHMADGHSVVVRRYVWKKFLREEPDAPLRELDALEFATANGLAAPHVVAADPTGTTFGDGTPTVVMTFLSGTAVAVPDPDRLAAVAAAIHDVSADGLFHDYFPWYRDTTTEPPHGARHPALWEDAIDRWRHHMPTYMPTLVHRDFHPGNVLWSAGKLSGVVDWVNACRGPWECDIAHCRDNLIRLADFDIADRFLHAYTHLTDKTFNPFWELASVLEHDDQWWTPTLICIAERRLTTALNLLG